MLRLLLGPASAEAPVSVINDSALRPSSGSASICSLVMVAPTAGLRVSTSGAAPSTETVCSRLPSSILTGMTGLLPTWSTRPVCEKVRNPESVASRRYGPVGRLSSAYEPVASVTASRRKPVSVCRAITVTPGSTAPLESATVPLICAVAWAHTCAAQSRTTIRASSGRDMRLIIEHPCCPN